MQAKLPFGPRATSILTEHILRTLDAVKRMPADFFTGKGKH